MNSFQKTKLWKYLLLILFFVAGIPIVFISLCIRDISLFKSLISDYISSGNSFFVPFFSYNNIIFQFSTGHLIDIIIVTNIIVFIERMCYQYYMIVCLRHNYYELYSDPYTFADKGINEESFSNSNLIINSREDLETIVNERFVEYYIYQTNTSQLSIKEELLPNPSKKSIQQQNLLLLLLKFSTNFQKNYHRPSKIINIFSGSNEDYLQKGGN